MKIAIPTETQHGESRVAASPDTVKAYVKKGAEVLVQAGAGKGASIPDDAFAAAGAKIANGGWGEADVVLTVRRPSAEVLAALKPGAILMGGLEPYGDKEGLEAIAKSGVTAFAMELMPRITRAQAMDILSSGTVPAAKVFIMGVGVAGLQAIATARRLGAIVSATDVRKATEEQVKSLGAKFVYADIADAATSGGYAKELSAEDKAKQAALVAEHVKTQDVIITTALIPGRPAPVLITEAMVDSMKPGSVIVDLAVERGGNCPLSKPDQIVHHKGVTLVGTVNLAGRLAGNASPLFAKNLANFLDLMIQKDGSLKIDDADECIKGTMIARGGALVHPMFQGAK